MALYVLGDTHLSLGASKPMDIFPGWDGYVERLERSWRKLITPQDTIVLAGDISWAMRLTDTRKDFAFLQQLPGQKLIMKGNHDYWWSYGQQDERLLESGRLRYPAHPAQQLLHGGRATPSAAHGAGCSMWGSRMTKRS